MRLLEIWSIAEQEWLRLEIELNNLVESLEPALILKLVPLENQS